MDINEFNLTTYMTPPSESCSLHELQQICEERLQLYKIMDLAYNLGHKPNSALWDKYVELQIMQHKLTTHIILLKNEDCSVGKNKAQRHNHIAHWLLSLWYCRTRDFRLFFIKCELQWFIMLYKRMKDEHFQQFFNDSKLECTLVSQEEKQLLKEQLMMCRNIKEVNFDNTNFYKVNFNQVSNLVAVRKVFLRKGVAYFPQSDLIFHIKSKLWKHLNCQLLWINKVLPTGIKEDRIEDFLNNISLVLPNSNRFTDGNVVVNLENIDDLAETHFPLCMKTIHSELRKEHHLKYDCKMQYGIFLKWIGLSYEDAMKFWKDEFTQKMSSEWYDRKYSYLFKHQYGKVGGMVQYNPFTCQKIQNSCPGPGQHHGCPFKHWDVDKVLKKCRRDGFSAHDINGLRDLIVGTKYKEACTMYFNVRHKVSVEDVFKSPNQYFEASYEFEETIGNCLVDIFNDCCDE